jgi:hypothetical protein
MRARGTKRSLSHLIFLFVVVLVSALTVPALAAAGGPWVVKDAAGHRIGYAQTDGSAYSGAARHPVYGPKRIADAWVTYKTQMAWFTRCKERSGWRPPAYVQQIGTSGWWMGPLKSGSWEGRLRKRDGRWLVLLKVNGAWRTRGSVTARCPAWLAGGAVYILLGDRWR